MRRNVFLALWILLFPSLVFAGFPRSGLWLSTEHPLSGETLVLYASLANQSEEVLSGTLRFLNGSTLLHETSVSLAPGESKTYTASFTPEEGALTLSAQFSDAKGMLVDEVSLSVPVAPRRAGPSLAAAVEDSAPIQKTIADLSPKAAQTLAPVFETIDSVRAIGASFIDERIVSSREKLQSFSEEKKSLGLPPLRSEEAEKRGRTIAAYQVFHTMLLYLLETLRFVISTAAVFYPLLAFCFFVILYKLYRRFRRPSYSEA